MVSEQIDLSTRKHQNIFLIHKTESIINRPCQKHLFWFVVIFFFSFFLTKQLFSFMSLFYCIKLIQANYSTVVLMSRDIYFQETDFSLLFHPNSRLLCKDETISLSFPNCSIVAYFLLLFTCLTCKSDIIHPFIFFLYFQKQPIKRFIISQSTDFTISNVLC